VTLQYQPDETLNRTTSPATTAALRISVIAGVLVRPMALTWPSRLDKRREGHPWEPPARSRYGRYCAQGCPRPAGERLCGRRGPRASGGVRCQTVCTGLGRIVRSA
jgi:hypothetical protein